MGDESFVSIPPARWRWSWSGPWSTSFSWRGGVYGVEGWSRLGVQQAAHALLMRLVDSGAAEPKRGAWCLTDAELEIWTAPPCPRCSGEIKVDWCDVTTLGDLVKGIRLYVPGEVRCSTLRCVDENGSKRVPLSALPEPEHISP